VLRLRRPGGRLLLNEGRDEGPSDPRERRPVITPSAMTMGGVEESEQQIRVCKSGGGVGKVFEKLFHRCVVVLEGADLDSAPAGDSEPGAPVPCDAQVGRRDDPKSAEVLLGLGEGSVGGDDLVVDHANDCRRRVVEAAGENQATPCGELVGEGVDSIVGPLELLLRERGLVTIDSKQVLRHSGSLLVGNVRTVSASYPPYERYPP
jgi:hypothetical protein